MLLKSLKKEYSNYKLHEKSIMYYMVDSSLDDNTVEELFVRMNTGGSQLSNAEIILSKLTTKWKSKARNRINGLIDSINNGHNKENKYIYDFSIDLDLIMKSYLVLLDKQSVSFKLSKILNDDNLINEMENKFEPISYALKNAFAFVKEYGFDHKVLRSNNAIIPIAYLIYKHNLYSEKSNYFLETKKYIPLQKTIIRWLCVTILSGFWSGANDSNLVLIRKTLNEYNGKIENLDFYQQLKSNSSIAGDMNKDIDFINNTLLTSSYNSSNTYAILCILYLNNKNFTSYIRNQYDIDHIFPQNKFKDAILDENNIDINKRAFYKENYNSLPNLQLLTPKENREEKRHKYFDEWINEYYDPSKIEDVLETHYIDKVYKFDQFETMFNKRKKVLAEKLLEIFK